MFVGAGCEQDLRGWVLAGRGLFVERLPGSFAVRALTMGLCSLQFLRLRSLGPWPVGQMLGGVFLGSADGFAGAVDRGLTDGAMFAEPVLGHTGDDQGPWRQKPPAWEVAGSFSLGTAFCGIVAIEATATDLYISLH